MKPRPHRKIGPLFEPYRHMEAKDPCVVYDGKLWHIYGTGVSKDDSGLKILHATSPRISGPWKVGSDAMLDYVPSKHAAAPGVIYDSKDGFFHMAIQEDFTSIGGKIEYFASSDGESFTRVSTILEPLRDSGEAGLYDPHFCLINSDKYLVYAGMPGLTNRDKPFIPQPDIYLAKSETGLWSGPWKRLGKILDHDDVDWHHNRRDHPDYEWGIEGPQLVELPDKKILLVGTCFLETGGRGTRQRVFFALSEKVEGPYETLGPMLSEGLDAWESGENGHATAVVTEDSLYLFYQARGLKSGWRYGIAEFLLKDLCAGRGIPLM
jgi:hypothetical protein